MRAARIPWQTHINEDFSQCYSGDEDKHYGNTVGMGAKSTVIPQDWGQVLPQ